jgi:putative flippase GtrA
MWIFVDFLLFYYLIARVIVAIIEGSLTFYVNNKYTFEMPKELDFGEMYFKGKEFRV